MAYTIQIFYPGAGLFMNTNHKSESLEELKSLSSSDLFSGSRVRVVDESQRVMFEPPVRESAAGPSLSGIASMLGVPIVDSPEDLFRNDEDNDAS